MLAIGGGEVVQRLVGGPGPARIGVVHQLPRIGAGNGLEDHRELLARPRGDQRRGQRRRARGQRRRVGDGMARGRGRGAVKNLHRLGVGHGRRCRCVVEGRDDAVRLRLAPDRDDMTHAEAVRALRGDARMRLQPHLGAEPRGAPRHGDRARPQPARIGRGHIGPGRRGRAAVVERHRPRLHDLAGRAAAMQRNVSQRPPEARTAVEDRPVPAEAGNRDGARGRPRRGAAGLWSSVRAESVIMALFPSCGTALPRRRVGAGPGRTRPVSSCAATGTGAPPPERRMPRPCPWRQVAFGE